MKNVILELINGEQIGTFTYGTFHFLGKYSPSKDYGDFFLFTSGPEIAESVPYEDFLRNYSKFEPQIGMYPVKIRSLGSLCRKLGIKFQ